MADAPSIPKGKECDSDKTMSSGYDNWNRRISGSKESKEPKKGEKK